MNTHKPGDIVVNFGPSLETVSTSIILHNSIVLPPAAGYRWKVAVMELLFPWHFRYILCSDIVQPVPIGHTILKVMSHLELKGHTIADGLKPEFMLVEPQYLGVPINEIPVQLKFERDDGLFVDADLTGLIHGRLHFKCE